MVASMELLRAGRLLVANPKLADSNFERTVVMLVAYGEEGALGLVLNRPSDMVVSSPLPQWAHLAAQPAVMFLGGPVAHQAVICLARALPGGAGHAPSPPAPPDRDLEVPFGGATFLPGLDEAGLGGGLRGVEGWKDLDGDLGTLDLDIDPDTVAGHLSALRLFAGYAGWAAGQLEAEIEAGAWWVLDSAHDDPFTPDPDALWKRVLLRQGEPLALVAFYPDNPAWN